MALRDTSWVWDTTSNSPKTANASITDIQTGVRVISQSGSTQSRSEQSKTYEWVGVTKSAALAFDSKLAADTSNTNKSASAREENRVIGSFVITMVENNNGAWS